MLGATSNLLGLGAGLSTSVLWTGTSILFTEGGRRLGSTVVNATRVALAIVVLGLIYRFFTSEDGAWFPTVESRQVVYLAVSGVIGLAIGDQCLFTAFVDIGPRIANLVMTTAPIFAVLFAWAFLGETLNATSWIGMSVTIAGVAWVVLERPDARIAGATPHRTRGIVLAGAGAACQAFGLMLSKAGMGHGWLEPSDHLAPQAATFVRMLFAGVAMVPVLALWRARAKRMAAAGRAPRRVGTRRAGFAFVVTGTFVGPVLGVWMSLVAADATSVGIAQTMLSLTPIFILPFAAILYREHIGVRAVLGAVVAVIGVAILFVDAV